MRDIQRQILLLNIVIWCLNVIIFLGKSGWLSCRSWCRYLSPFVHLSSRSLFDKQLTLWSYQLLQKGRRFSAAKLHYIDFNGPLLSLSCIDIQYWVSYNPVICRKSWKMTSRKKIRFLGLAQIVPLFNGLIFKKSLFGTNRC